MYTQKYTLTKRVALVLWNNIWGSQLSQYSSNCTKTTWKPTSCTAQSALPLTVYRTACFDINHCALLAVRCWDHPQMSLVSLEGGRCPLRCPTTRFNELSPQARWGELSSTIIAKIVSSGSLARDVWWWWKCGRQPGCVLNRWLHPAVALPAAIIKMRLKNGSH